MICTNPSFCPFYSLWPLRKPELTVSHCERDRAWRRNMYCDLIVMDCISLLKIRGSQEKYHTHNPNTQKYWATQQDIPTPHPPQKKKKKNVIGSMFVSLTLLFHEKNCKKKKKKPYIFKFRFSLSHKSQFVELQFRSQVSLLLEDICMQYGCGAVFIQEEASICMSSRSVAQQQLENLSWNHYVS